MTGIKWTQTLFASIDEHRLACFARQPATYQRAYGLVQTGGYIPVRVNSTDGNWNLHGTGLEIVLRTGLELHLELGLEMAFDVWDLF